jgi:hypothetical protein
MVRRKAAMVYKYEQLHSMDMPMKLNVNQRRKRNERAETTAIRRFDTVLWAE